MLFADPRRLRKMKKLARVVADRAALRFVHGLSLVIDGSFTPVGRTPYDVVHKRGKVEVWRYRRPPPEVLEIGTERIAHDRPALPVPVLFIPPLMVRPYVYDLRRDHSFVEFLLTEGFDVFLVDFGVPDSDDAHVKLDHYVLDWLPEAVSVVCREAGSPSLSLLGYCMGGIFALVYAAAHCDARVKNLVTIAAPVDFDKMGLLSWFAQRAHRQADALTRRMGNIPGELTALGMRLTAPVKTITKYADLFVNLWDEEYVKGFDSIHQWTTDFIPYPKEAFRQFLRDFMTGNKLMSGELSFRDRPARLSDVKIALLAFAGKDDNIAPLASAEAIVEKVGSPDKTFQVVPGGHIGVVAGSRAPACVWRPTASWLSERSRL